MQTVTITLPDEYFTHFKASANIGIHGASRPGDREFYHNRYGSVIFYQLRPVKDAV